VNFIVLLFVGKSKCKEFLRSGDTENFEEKVLRFLENLSEVSEEYEWSKGKDWMEMRDNFKDLIFVVEFHLPVVVWDDRDLVCRTGGLDRGEVLFHVDEGT
jgi:hypothetical protein